jgi:hypothetical protein
MASSANNLNDLNDLEGLTDEELQNIWDITLDFEERNKIVSELQRRNLFPSNGIRAWELETGAYPDIIDPMFLQKLLAKREFAESLQTSWKPRSDPCEDEGTFEVTPVQRFVANFMSPKTPYMSALLFHGVGVGKTCAAVQIIEAWLEAYPRTEVYLVAPPTIQQGFYRTIFDISKVIIGEGDEPNTASQCTGDLYMRLSNTIYERNLQKIEKAVYKLIRRRYKIFGYISFANYIRDIIKGIPTGISEEQKLELKKEYIRREFSGKLLVVDEAHNLRDLAEDMADEEPDAPGGKADKSDSAGGKQLTPYLRDVLQYSEGMKFATLTATPMYNTYREIIFILNLLLLNDKKATIVESDVFDKDGNIKDSGKKILAHCAQRYVSFMRGENPVSFPIRLFPQNVSKITTYPTHNPRGTDIEEEDTDFYKHLPIVPITLTGDVLKASMAFMDALPPGKGLSSIALEKLVHAGNFIVPPTDGTNSDDIEAYRARTDITGLSTIFKRETIGGEVRFKALEEGGAAWLGGDQIRQYSPKFAFLLEKAKTCEGVVFAYTRFVNAGALPLALALEANGYLPYGRKSGLLGNGIQTPGGRQCALCPLREKEHSSARHAFTPAYYGLLTGDINISPNNEQVIRGERASDNSDGSKMKIIIGSQIASEGVDLRFVRETHVIDSWFHLNKTEQILGRAIRYLSHCALPKEKRNNTVYLYVGILPSGVYSRETADLYSYRIGFKKAVQVGHVTRILKQAAIDCNLNNQAIVIQGQAPVDLVDSQRQVREGVNINDTPFTAVCDWIETCRYECTPKINIDELEMDNSTYDEYSAKWRVNKLKDRIRVLFSEQVFYRNDDLWNILSDIPRMTVVDLLTEIVNNKSFQVRHDGVTGYIRYCNGYYIFQPNVYADLTIPLAIRIANFPIKRDAYTAVEYEMPEITEEETGRIDTFETIDTIWAAVSDWCYELSTSDEYTPPPDELNQRIVDIAQDNLEVVEKYKNMLEMIDWFHISYVKSSNKNQEAFRKAVLYYFWDKWFTLTEQKYLVYSSDLDVNECVENGEYQLGRVKIIRFVNPKNNMIEYMCEGGEPCGNAYIDAVTEDRDEPMRKLKANNTTTGQLYGFVVPKKNEFVFKTAEPVILGAKAPRGKECANVSNMSGHYKQLYEIGEILKVAGLGDFDLRASVVQVTRKIRNSIRACTLLELILRYMDLCKVQNKKWIYRPLESVYVGHKGTSS